MARAPVFTLTRMFHAFPDFHFFMHACRYCFRFLFRCTLRACFSNVAMIDHGGVNFTR